MSMDKNITLKNIANYVGVSVSTVSRVLNGKADKYRIGIETAEKIIEASNRFNYSPNQLARSLRLKKTDTLGYIIPDISNPFFASIAKSIENAARLKGYTLILCDSEERTEIELDSIKLLIDKKVDGLIISPVGLKLEHLKKVKENNIPLVLLDRYFPNLDLPFVTSDNYSGAYEAVNFLIQKGHTQIACLQGLKNTSPNNDRVRGYKAALKANEVPLNSKLIVGKNFGEENGYVQTKTLLKRKVPPTAIFALGNLISLGALRAISELGLKVPEDISIISFDDQPYSQLLATPMTTISQQTKQIGTIAINMLLDRIEYSHNLETKGIFLPTKLVVRNSVKEINNSQNAISMSAINQSI